LIKITVAILASLLSGVNSAQAESSMYDILNQNPLPVASAVLSNSRQLECMTQAIYFEARGEHRVGKIAVAQVVMNRVRSRSYPNDVCAVVYQKNYKAQGCQFTWACYANNKITSKTLYDESRAVAQAVLSGAVTTDPTGGAVSFNNRPFRGQQLHVKIGNHYFYRSKAAVGAAKRNKEI